MKKIYKIDHNGIFTGEESKTNDIGIAKRWVRESPPETPEGKFAKYVNGDWVILDSYPVNNKKEKDVPFKLELRQVKLLLLERGEIDSIESYINNLKDEKEKRKMKIIWDSKNEVHRNDEIVKLVADYLNYNESQIDDFFIEASKI